MSSGLASAGPHNLIMRMEMLSHPWDLFGFRFFRTSFILDSFIVTWSILNRGSAEGRFGRVLSVVTVVHWVAKRVLNIFAFFK